jgi:hypothetical protein
MSVGPCQPSVCSEKYSQNDGSTDVEINRKKTSPSEKTTAVVHDHSNSFRNASTRSLRVWVGVVLSTWLIRSWVPSVSVASLPEAGRL